MKDILNELCSYMKNELNAFCYLCSDDAKLLSGYFECRNVKAGETLWKEGDSCDYVAFITSGRLEVNKETEFEGKSVIVGLYSKGAFVGELCILDGSPRALTAVAREDVSLVVITQKSFNELVNKHPELGVQLLKGMLLSVSKRLRKSFGRLAAIF
ncbi:MAG: cyclic nucleotide-binding domain-containing protein [Nitrospirota bacterium]